MPRFSTDHRRANDAVLDAVRTALMRRRFRPALLGGCAPRAMVQMMYSFELQ